MRAEKHLEAYCTYLVLGTVGREEGEEEEKELELQRTKGYMDINMKQTKLSLIFNVLLVRKRRIHLNLTL